MPSTSVHHVDSVLLALGPRGLYQMSHFLVAVLGTFPSTWQLFSNVFISRQVSHQCAIASNDSVSLGWPSLHGNNNISVTYGTCEISKRANGDSLTEQPCLFGVEYKEATDSSIVSQFDLVCERTALARLSQTLFIVGQGMGAIVTTILSDRFGRKKVLVLTNFALLASGLIIAYAPNYTVFAIFKFVAGVFQQGVVTCGVTFGMELLPTKSRRLSQLLGGLAFAFGVQSMALVSFLLRHESWRTTQMVYSLCSLVAVIQWWYMDESIRWLIANNRSEEAARCIQRAAKMNKKKFSDILQAYESGQADAESATSSELQRSLDTGQDGQASDQVNMLKSSARKLTFLDLLRVRRLLIIAVITWFAWFTCSLGFFALYLSSSDLSGNPYLNFFLVALMEIPSNVIPYFLLNRLGRKRTAVLFFAIQSIGLLVLGVLQSLKRTKDLDIITLVIYLVASLGSSGSFGVVFYYTPEMFPTNLRNQALGVASLMARVGGMLAPFAGVLADIATWAPGLLIGCCACLVSLLLRFLPETKCRELPQTIEELEMWFKKSKQEENRLRNHII